MKTIIVLGDINLDIIISQIEDYPSFGKEILARTHIIKAGGSAANVAMMLAVKGCPVQFFGRVGKDFAGEYIQQYLEKYGLQTDTLTVTENELTGITVSLAYPKDRMYITFPGTIITTKIENLHEPHLSKEDHLHLSSYFLQKGLKLSMGEILMQAKQRGMTTSLDPGGDSSGRWDIKDLEKYFQYIDFFLPNTNEILGITKKENMQEALTVFAPEIKGIIVKAGERGSFTRYKGKMEHYPALPAAVIDTTCAGDCFDAGFLYGFSTGCSFSESVHMGNKFGALAVSTIGLPFKKMSGIV